MHKGKYLEMYCEQCSKSQFNILWLDIMLLKNVPFFYFAFSKINIKGIGNKKKIKQTNEKSN